MEEAIYWLALQQKYWLVPANKIATAVEELGSIEKFWNASEEYLAKLGLGNTIIKKFSEYRSNIDLSQFERQYHEILQNKIRLIRCTDEEYPSMLKSIGSHAPRLLFCKGTTLNFDNCVAVGGRRDCTENGCKEAYNISRKLAENGYTVVSGLAVGIDTEAHKGALDGGGRTIAVLAWMNPIYPPENLGLSRSIEKHGAILSECYKKPITNLKWRFVERNKVISGLSNFIIIIEGRDRGGSFSLAKESLFQRKKVFVIKPETNNEEILKDYESLLKKLKKQVIPINSHEELLEFIIKNKTKPKSSYQSSLTTFANA